MMNNEGIDSIDCLQNKCPHSSNVRDIVEYFDSLGRDSRFDIARIIFSINVFCHVLKILKNDFSIRDYMKILDDNYFLARETIKQQSVFNDMLVDSSKEELIEGNSEKTKKHYSTMFSNIGDVDFFEISPDNLKKLFILNNFKFDCPEIKTALDAGCGSGRYSYALKLLGFSNVVGMDFSSKNIEFAQNKINSRQVGGIEFHVGDVTDMLFDDESFDFVLSNGVLHHVDKNYDLVLSELHRVLKPGGNAYFYVMERPGGIFLDTIDIVRYVLKNVPESTTLHCMEYLGFKGYTIYNILDHVYVPINKRVSREEIERHILNAGFNGMEKFERGLPNYNIELLRKNPRDTENIWKYGIGEHMYILKK
ncbi:MAG: hypothetical protein BA863_11555 [Desulfovibrio sp. S3730MH75]|nr:MAG: hypothetical protein BA863_11555 [Desulfovibrio sp. S3730MH75]